MFPICWIQSKKTNSVLLTQGNLLGALHLISVRVRDVPSDLSRLSLGVPNPPTPRKEPDLSHDELEDKIEAQLGTR